MLALIAYSPRIQPVGNVALNTIKCASSDEKDVGGIHFNEFLVGVFATSLRRHIHLGALEQFEQCLLNAFSGNVPRDGRIVRFPGDLIDLINEDDPSLCRFHIVIRRLQKPREYAFHIFTHITSLGQHRGIHNGERHIEHACNGTCE